MSVDLTYKVYNKGKLLVQKYVCIVRVHSICLYSDVYSDVCSDV
jgi:hypothetical protein